MPLDAGEAGALQDVHVLGDGGERHVEAGGELADRALPFGELGEDVAPRGVGECGEGGVERVGLVNHVV